MQAGSFESRVRTRLLVGLIVGVFALTIISLAWAQGGARPEDGTQEAIGNRPAAQPPFEKRFWEYLQVVKY